MIRVIIVFVTVLILSGCSGKPVPEILQSEYEKLREGFQDPPQFARPKVYWWWLNGNADAERLITEMREMKKAGISGFDIFEIGVPASDVMVEAGPAFMSDESLHLIKSVLDEAGKLGMEAGLNMASSWNAGGSWIRPEHAAKSIYFSQTKLNTKTGRIKLSFPQIPEKDPRGRVRKTDYTQSGKPVWYRDIAVVAVPADTDPGQIDTTRILNLTSRFDPISEELDWNVTEGEWNVYRYVCSNSGEQLMMPSKNSAGPIIDHFDSSATEFHFNYIIDRLKTVIPDIKNSALKSMYLASYESTGTVWTPSIPDEFRRINGYDIYKFLPVLSDPSSFKGEASVRFMADFRRTLSELMINNFYKKAREIANNSGLMINSEAGGPGLPLHNVPVEPLKALGALDIPRGEFWINHSRLNEQGIDILRVVKEVSAASHIYGRGIVEEESFTTFQQWQEAPVDMKPLGDRAFCEGLNKVVVHGFSHNPPGTGYPGYVYHAGTHFNDKRIWWPMVRPFNDYLARISFIARESRFCADVLYYYGDKIPNYAGHKNSRFVVAPGYNYEVINTEILMQLATVNGELVLPGGARFKILCLEDEGEINSDVLLKLKDLAGSGALIIGEKPAKFTRLRDPGDTTDYQNLTDKLWMDFSNRRTSRVLPRSKIISGISPEQALSRINVVPDFTYKDDSFYFLDYIHYEYDDLHFYFVRNTQDKWVSYNCSFRQTDKVPEIWDPVTGKIFPVPVHNQNNDYITIPVAFAPYQSFFFVFRDGIPVTHYTAISDKDSLPPAISYGSEGFNILDNGIFSLSSEDEDLTVSNTIKVKVVDGAWELFFPEGQDTPGRIILPELISWTQSDIPSVRYFSGIVKYVKTFHYDVNSVFGKEYSIFLDLGELSKIATVNLNGKDLGTAWTFPFRFDVTEILKNGDNVLTVEVANTWSNRLTGDAITGQKYTNTNIRTTIIPGLDKIYIPWKEVPLIPSGLFGPVSLMIIPRFDISDLP